MARGDTAQARINVTTNAEKAKNDIEEVNTLLKKLQKTKQLMMKEGLHLTADGKETATFKRLNRDIKDTQESMKRLTDRQTLMNKTLGNLNDIKLKELKTRYRELTKELGNFSGKEQVQAERWRRDLERIQQQIVKIEGAGKGASKSMAGFGGSLGTTLKNLVAYAGVFAGFNYVKEKFMEMVRGNVELSDSMAQVRKVTGLTKREVDDLNKSFVKLDTRSTITQLNELAYSAGKMGLGKYGLEGVEGFVRATNQLQVALGDDLGDSVDESITPLAKLAENLGLIQKMGVEKSMMAIGSSINELSQTTTAAGANIVDFARRIQPSAQMIGLATDEILALGSASDSFGISSEISATAFTKFLAAYRTNTAEIERILGMTRGTLDAFFDQGRTIDGLMAIFQRMHEIGDLRYLEEAFKALGSEGSRMFTTFGAFAKNIDMFRDHLNTSRTAFSEATSITREYMLVQDTAAGLLERANNIWEKAFVNPEGVDTVKELARTWYDLSKELTGSETWMMKARDSLTAIAKVIGIIIQLSPLLIRALAFYGLAQGIRKIYTEFVLMNSAMAAAGTTAGKLGAFLRSPVFVVAFTAIGFAASALYEMAAAGRRAQMEMEKTGDAMKQAADEGIRASARERDELKKLYDATQNQKLAMEERTKAALEMKKKYPQYFSDLTTEQILAGKAADAYADLTNQIINAAKARAMEKRIEELEENNLDLEDENRRTQEWQEKNKERYEQEKAKIDAAVSQQNRMEQATGSANMVGGKMGYVRAVNAGDRQIVGLYQSNEQQIAANNSKIAENNKMIERMAEEVKRIKPVVSGTDDKGNKTFTPSSGGNTGNGGSTKELNAEYRNEQAKVKDIINKVKNFYQRQINAINDMATVGTIGEQEQKDLVKGMQVRMNTALAEVRKAIGGTENEWEAFKKTMISDLYEPLKEDGTNWSTDLVQDIVNNDLVQLRKMIDRLSAALNKNGQQLLEQILRKATEDEGKNIDIANEQMRARQEELRRKNYTEQVDYNFINTMDQFQVGDTTAEQNAFIQSMSQTGNRKAIEDFFEERTRLWRDGFKNARENLLALIDTDIESEQGQKSLLALLYGADYEQTLKGSALEGLLNMDATQWKIYYQKLIEYSDAWDDAQKKVYEEQKRRMDYRFDNSPEVIGLNKMEQNYESRQRDNARWGKPQTMAERMGLGRLSAITDDPEVKMMEVRLTKARLYFDEMKRLRDMNLVSQEMADDAMQKMQEAQIALQDKVAQNAQAKMQQIQQLLDPIKDFGAAAGDAMYMTINNLDGEGDAWRNAVKSIIRTYGEMTIQMIEKQLIQMLVLKQHHQEEETEEQAHQDRMKQIKNEGVNSQLSVQNLLNSKLISVKKKGDKMEEKEALQSEDTKVDIAGEGGKQLLDIGATVASGMVNAKREEAQETQAVQQQQQATSLSGLISDTIAKVVLGIAGGSARTVSELGWWGLPLVAVISAALMGLLNYALSAIGSGSSSNKNTAAKPKVKLVSGMLTYDEGNVSEVVGGGHRRQSGVQSYLGQDGRIYRATPETAPKTGLITRPIATTVQGNPALVAERGPEIVIGRKTTRRIMMNEPGLLHYINTIERSGYRPYFGGRGLRTYDEGNLADVLSQAGAAPGGSDQQSRQDDRIAQALEQNAQMMSAFAQMMNTIQQQGLHAIVPKFGKGSFDEALRDVQQFRKKYPNG